MKPDHYYHVYNRANAFEKLFYNEENYRFFLETCYRYISKVGAIYTFALLPNHFHFLIKTHSIEGLNSTDYGKYASQTFSNLFNSYTKSFNRYYRRRGTLFSRHFKNCLLDTITYRTNCVLYILHNAVHHKLCEYPEEWKYTSHSLCMSDAPSAEISEALSWFGGRDQYSIAYNNYRCPLDGEIYLEQEA